MCVYLCVYIHTNTYIHTFHWFCFSGEHWWIHLPSTQHNTPMCLQFHRGIECTTNGIKTWSKCQCVRVFVRGRVWGSPKPCSQLTLAQKPQASWSKKNIYSALLCPQAQRENAEEPTPLQTPEQNTHVSITPVLTWSVWLMFQGDNYLVNCLGTNKPWAHIGEGKQYNKQRVHK